MKNVPGWHQSIVTVFGVFGYLSCALQWLWLGVLFLPQLLSSEAKNLLLPPSSETSTPTSFNLDGDGLLITALGIAVTLIVLIITVVVLIRLPMGIAKTGNKVAKTAADTVLPVVTHHKKVSAKKRRMLTIRIIKIIKLLLVLLPMALLATAFIFDAPLPKELIFMIGSILAIGSLLWFSLEYITARWLRVPVDRII